MGKFLQKTLILAILIVSTLCFSSCSLNAEAKLKKIAPDVDYDFVLTYNFGKELVINGTHYDLEEIAYNIFKKKATDFHEQGRYREIHILSVYLFREQFAFAERQKQSEMERRVAQNKR